MHKPLIRFEKRKKHSSFIDNIWGADLDDIQLSKLIIEFFFFLLRVVNIDSKYAWVISLINKKGITITIYSQNILDELGRKSSKIWEMGRQRQHILQ